MGRSAEAYQEQQQEQQEQQELQFYLWTCLEGLRGHISVETFQQVEREIGLN